MSEGVRLDDTLRHAVLMHGGDLVKAEASPPGIELGALTAPADAELVNAVRKDAVVNDAVN